MAQSFYGSLKGPGLQKAFVQVGDLEDLSSHQEEVVLKKRSVQPPTQPTPLPPAASPDDGRDFQAFTEQNRKELTPEALAFLHGLTDEERRYVVAAGSLSGCRDALGILKSRLRRMREGERPPPGPATKGETEEFLRANLKWLNEAAELLLRSLSPEEAGRVLAAGPLVNCRDPVAVIKARLRKESKDQSHPPPSQPPPSSLFNLPEGGDPWAGFLGLSHAQKQEPHAPNVTVERGRNQATGEAGSINANRPPTGLLGPKPAGDVDRVAFDPWAQAAQELRSQKAGGRAGAGSHLETHGHRGHGHTSSADAGAGGNAWGSYKGQMPARASSLSAPSRSRPLDSESTGARARATSRGPTFQTPRAPPKPPAFEIQVAKPTALRAPPPPPLPSVPAPALTNGQVVDALLGSGMSGVYIELTFCQGSLAQEALHRLPPRSRLYGFSVDPAAALLGRDLEKTDPRFRLVQKPVEDLKEALQGEKAAGMHIHASILSTISLPEGSPETFGQPRMSLSSEQWQRLEQWLSTAAEEEIAWVVREHSEDADPVLSLRIAEAVVRRQSTLGPFASGLDLIELLSKVWTGPGSFTHEAEQTLKAFLSFVGGACERLKALLEASLLLLEPGARMVITTSSRAEAAAVIQFVRDHDEPTPRLQEALDPSRCGQLYPWLRTGQGSAVRQVTKSAYGPSALHVLERVDTSPPEAVLTEGRPLIKELFRRPRSLWAPRGQAPSPALLPSGLFSLATEALLAEAAPAEAAADRPQQSCSSTARGDILPRVLEESFQPQAGSFEIGGISLDFGQDFGTSFSSQQPRPAASVVEQPEGRGPQEPGSLHPPPAERAGTHSHRRHHEESTMSWIDPSGAMSFSPTLDMAPPDVNW